MSKNLNIEIMRTAAESPWSNGACEHHNAVIGNMVTKIVAEMKCTNSPNQLVFGRNLNSPSVINDKPPALEGTTSSEVVAKNLNALHEAWKAFIENEKNSEEH